METEDLPGNLSQADRSLPERKDGAGARDRTERERPTSPFRLIPLAREPWFHGYAIAVACSLAAFMLRWALDPFLRDRSPLLLFAVAVAVSSIRGFGAGILATVLGAAGALYFFPPMGTFSHIERGYWPTAALQLALFVTLGLTLSLLSAKLRRLRWRAENLLLQRNDILDSITDGFTALDGECRIVYLNDRAASQARSPRETRIGQIVWDELPEWGSSAIQTQLLDVLKNRVAAHFEYHSDDSGRWFEFHAHPAARGGLTVYFTDISARKTMEEELRETVSQLDRASRQVHLLSGLLPICASCKKIRDERGQWHGLESYITAHSDAEFSHGLCDDCAQRYWDELS